MIGMSLVGVPEDTTCVKEDKVHRERCIAGSHETRSGRTEVLGANSGVHEVDNQCLVGPRNRWRRKPEKPAWRSVPGLRARRRGRPNCGHVTLA